jgi:hypothetical protein
MAEQKEQTLIQRERAYRQWTRKLNRMLERLGELTKIPVSEDLAAFLQEWTERSFRSNEAGAQYTREHFADIIHEMRFTDLPRPLNERERELLWLIGGHIGIALKNDQYREAWLGGWFQ